MKPAAIRSLMQEQPTEAQIDAAADALIDESNRGDWEYDEACRVAAAILRAALAAKETNDADR